MQNEQRSGKELYEEWRRLSDGGVIGASIEFAQSLSIEERKRLFEYDAERERRGL